MAQKVLSNRSLRRLARKRAHLLCSEGGFSSDSDEEGQLNLMQSDHVGENSEESESAAETPDDTSTGTHNDRYDIVERPEVVDNGVQALGCQAGQAHPQPRNENNIDNEVFLYDIDTSSLSDFSSDNEDDYDIQTNLRNWVLQSNTPHVHVNSLLGILRHNFPHLPKDARTLLVTPRESNQEIIAGGEYHHFGIANGLETKFENFPELVADMVKMKINVDGVPIFKSSNAQFWPILGLIENDMTAEPFVIGLWVGKSKPNSVDAFLQYFVEEMQTLEQNGLLFNGRHIEIGILNCICDAVAKALIKQIKGHTGYYGCDKCTQPGVWLNNRMSFPEVRAPLRTDDMFSQMADEDHHIGHCPLQDINIGLVSQFPADPMHLVFLGVVKKLILLMMKGPLTVRLSNHMVNTISEALVSFAPYIPKEFARKGRALSEVDRWKATEFKNFLLFTGPVAFKGVISEEAYNNFIMLHVAISILSGDDISGELCDYMLNSFSSHLYKTFLAYMVQIEFLSMFMGLFIWQMMSDNLVPCHAFQLFLLKTFFKQ